MSRSSVLVVLGAVLVMGASSVAWASFFDLMGPPDLPAPTYMEKKEEVLTYPQGVMIMNTLLSNVTGQKPIPANGVDNDCDSFFDIFTEVSTDGGASWVPMTGHGNAVWRFTGGPTTAGVQTFTGDCMQLTAIACYGVSGPPEVMIRESPTLASTGGGSCTNLGAGGGGGGGYKIDSFFDIFTELSVDGGQTWAPPENNSTMHIDGTPEPATLSLMALGGLAAMRKRRKVR